MLNILCKWPCDSIRANSKCAYIVPSSMELGRLSRDRPLVTLFKSDFDRGDFISFLFCVSFHYLSLLLKEKKISVDFYLLSTNSILKTRETCISYFTRAWSSSFA